MYELRIKHLEEAHRALDKQVDTLERTGLFEDLKLEELKKQREAEMSGETQTTI